MADKDDLRLIGLRSSVAIVRRRQQVRSRTTRTRDGYFNFDTPNRERLTAHERQGVVAVLLGKSIGNTKRKRRVHCVHGTSSRVGCVFPV